jgi:hypothetical protein
MSVFYIFSFITYIEHINRLFLFYEKINFILVISNENEKFEIACLIPSTKKKIILQNEEKY